MKTYAEEGKNHQSSCMSQSITVRLSQIAKLNAYRFGMGKGMVGSLSFSYIHFASSKSLG